MRAVNGADLAADESGAVLAFVALGLVVFLGCAAIAIDLGNVWAHRRAVSTATDAAALAAAQEYAVGGTGCSGVAADYVDRNLTDAVLSGCAHVTTGAGGRIDVGAAVDVQHWFAPVLGIGSSDVVAETSAFYGSASGADGVRPIGLCAASPAYAGWGGGLPSGEIFVPFELTDPSPCGTGDIGAWALLGPWCGSAANAVASGFPERITPYQPACVEQTDIGSVAQAVAAVRAAEEPVAIPIFELFGETTKIVALAGVEFTGPVVTEGAPGELGVPIRFTTVVTTGDCCAAVDRGVRVVGICRADGTGTRCP